MRRVIFAVSCFLSLQILALAQGERPLLLRHPTVSQTQIVFSFAGDLWIVARDGGDARRLTSGVGVETRSLLLAGRDTDRVQRRVRRQPGRLRRAGGRRRAEAADLSPGRRHGRRAGRPTDGTSPSSPRAPATTTSPARCTPCRRRAASRRSAAADRRAGLVLARRLAPRLRAASAVAARVEALSRRPDDADLDREPRRLADRARSRARTRTTSTRCGSATRSTSCRIATVPVSLFAYDTQHEAGDRSRARTTGSTSSPRPRDQAPSSSSSSARSSCSTWRRARCGR